MKERNSVFEALRIVAILSIVAGHVLQARLPELKTQSADFVLACLFGSGLRIAVNIFVLIGAYYLVDLDFHLGRLKRLYLTTLVCSLVTLLAAFWQGPVGIVEILRSVFPILGVKYWFVTVYLVFLALVPFLRGFFNLPRRSQCVILALVGGFTVLFSSYPYPRVGSMERFLGWFIYLFLLVGFLKHETPIFRTRARGIAGILIAAASYAALVILCTLPEPFATLGHQYVHDVAALPNIACAWGLLVFCANLTPRYSAVINWLSARTLGVYLLHGAVLAGLGTTLPAWELIALAYILSVAVDALLGRLCSLVRNMV